MLLHRLIERGNGAERQRRHERAGGLPFLLRRLADETADHAAATPMLEQPAARGSVEMAA
jgi:hypothetical protein